MAANHCGAVLHIPTRFGPWPAHLAAWNLPDRMLVPHGCLLNANHAGPHRTITLKGEPHAWRNTEAKSSTR